MFVKFVETSKAYDKDRPGAQEQAKYRYKCMRQRQRASKQMHADVNIRIADMKDEHKENLRAQGANQLHGCLSS